MLFRSAAQVTSEPVQGKLQLQRIAVRMANMQAGDESYVDIIIAGCRCRARAGRCCSGCGQSELWLFLRDLRRPRARAYRPRARSPSSSSSSATSSCRPCC